MKHLVHLDYTTVKTVCQEGDVHVRAHLKKFWEEISSLCLRRCKFLRSKALRSLQRAIQFSLIQLSLFEVKIKSAIFILAKRILDVKKIVLFFGHVKHICE